MSGHELKENNNNKKFVAIQGVQQDTAGEFFLCAAYRDSILRADKAQVVAG